MTQHQELVNFIKFFYQNNIRSHQIIEGTAPALAPFPADFHPRLEKALRDLGINSLYSHQYEAYQSLSQQKDTLLVSRTASGKTLSFLLPILNQYLTEKPPFTVFLFYPTKALSRDQEGTLGKLLELTLGERGLGTFDGDTPREERLKIQNYADFIITNPDMLHSGILPNHFRKWRGFLSRLKYIVIDEVHTYRGTFGSHVALVLKRLLRLCELYGSKPTFVCSSATIGNPQEHVESLLDRPFVTIDNDGSPRPRRDFFFINPPLMKSHGASLYRKGTSSVSIPLIREATKKGIRTICFCRARQQVERLYRAVTDGRPELRSKIKPYRGGLLPNERRNLEQDLFSGRLNTVITTNALELGIDIGGLDLCILSGFPGSMASFWQQVGRVGRNAKNGKGAVIVLVGKESPIDQFMMNHPDFLLRSSPEKAWLNPQNPYIFLQHLPCAANELPLSPVPQEEKVFEHFPETLYTESLDMLTKAGQLALYRNRYHYIGHHFPSRGVNLRGMTDYNIQIFCGTEVIGELDPIGARGTLYKDAIYQHLGNRYMSLDLDLKKKLCHVAEVNVDYFTEAVWESRVVLQETDEERDFFGGKVSLGGIYVNRQPKLYKKIRERTLENIGYGPITLEPFEYETVGFALKAPPAWIEALSAMDKRFISAAFFGLSFLLKGVAPSYCMCDRGDLETDVSLGEDDWALFLFDSHQGGVGLGEKVFETLEEILDFCQEILRECECEMGCPACVPALPPGILNEELESFLIESNAARESTRSLIRALREGIVEIPQVKKNQSLLTEAYMVSNKDLENLEKLRSKIHRASRILDKKRDTLHE